MANSKQDSESNTKKATSTKILRSQLNQLIEILHASDSSLATFGKRISDYPSVRKQLLRAANSSLTGSSVEITEPAHAALFLGTRRVEFLLNTLPPEIIEEDQIEDGDSPPAVEI